MQLQMPFPKQGSCVARFDPPVATDTRGVAGWSAQLPPRDITDPDLAHWAGPRLHEFVPLVGDEAEAGP